jgi:hypothetical protein
MDRVHNPSDLQYVGWFTMKKFLGKKQHVYLIITFLSGS